MEFVRGVGKGGLVLLNDLFHRFVGKIKNYKFKKNNLKVSLYGGTLFFEKSCFSYIVYIIVPVSVKNCNSGSLKGANILPLL